MKKIIIRLDDISWDMSFDNFKKAKDIFIKYDIKPIIGVIPNNHDPKLKKYGGEINYSKEQFWNMIRELQNEYGWRVALHGYDHVYLTENGGVLKKNKRSEFAGLPYEVQLKKIVEGKRIIESNGLRISAFMAPAHSFDLNTIGACIASKIPSITDGIGIYPFVKRGMLFVPQMNCTLHSKGFGVDTVCFHLNEWEHARFNLLEEFIRENREMFIDYDEAMKESGVNFMWSKIANGYIQFKYCVYKVGRNIKHIMFAD